VRRVLFLAIVVSLAISSLCALAVSKEITVWLSWLEPAQRDWLLQRYFPTFEKEKGIKINAVEMPGDEETLRAQLVAGKGPDVVGMAGPSFAPLYIEAGFLTPLGDYAKKYEWDKLLVDLYWELGHYKGEFYTIPQEFEAMVLFYNPRVFKENGWVPPKTIDEMEALAAKMKEKGIMAFANGNVGWKPAIEWVFTAAVNHIAGPEKVYQALVGEIPWTDPCFVEAVETTKKWFKMGWLGDGKFFSLDVGEVYQLLVEGKAGMAIWGTWAFGDLVHYSTSSEDWDWVPFPSKEGVPYPVFAFGVGSSVGINKNAKDPDAVAEFLNFDLRMPLDNLDLFIEDLKINGSAAYTPIRGFDWGEETMKTMIEKGVDERVLRFLKQATEAFENNTYGYVTWTFWPPKSDRYIIDTLEMVWLDKMSTQEFLQGLQDVFAKGLEEGASIYIPPRS